MTRRVIPGGSLHLPIDRRAFLRASTLLAGAGIVGIRPGSAAWAQESAADMAKAYEAANIDWRQESGKTIVLAGLQHPWMDALTPLIPIFTALTGIEVTVELQSETEYTASMPVKLGAGSGTPDVYMIWALGQAITAGWLAPTAPFEEDPALFDAAWYDKEDIFSSGRAFQQWGDGQSYGFAITAEAQTLFINEEMLSAAGLSAPTSMTALYETAMALKTNDVAGIAMRAKATGDAAPWPLGGFVFSHGGSIVTLDGTSGLLLPQTVAAVEMYGKLLRDAGPVGISSYHWMECLNDFMQGAVAMGCDSSNFATDIANPDKSTVAGKTLYAALPAADGQTAKPNMWHWMAGINANSANKNAAWLFMLWATSKETSAMTAAAGLATPRSSAWATSAFSDRFGAQAAEASLANLQAADGDLFKATWFHPRSPEILDPVAIAVNEVITGSKDAAAAMADADAKVAQVLAG